MTELLKSCCTIWLLICITVSVYFILFEPAFRGDERGDL